MLSAFRQGLYTVFALIVGAVGICITAAWVMKEVDALDDEDEGRGGPGVERPRSPTPTGGDAIDWAAFDVDRAAWGARGPARELAHA